MNDLVEVSGISTDWCALEIKYGSKLYTSQLIKVDNFSCGLLILSVNCLKGQPPPSKDLNAALEVIRSCPDMLTSLSSLLENALARHSRKTDCNGHWQLEIYSWTNLNSASSDQKQGEAGQVLHKKEDAQRPFVHPWRLPSLGAFLFQGLEKSYQQYKTWMTGPQLFAMFLLKSYGEVRKVDKSLQMEMLLCAAEKGHIPAQAVVSRVSQSYNIPHDVNKTFLYNRASYGSLLARHELEFLDSALASEALDKFRSSTGFSQFYSPLAATDKYSDDIKDEDDNTYIHFLSVRGEFQKLRESLLANGTTLNINARNFIATARPKKENFRTR
ncbi:MAG: hypothetical protein MMC33_001722 [Icmadophila ericetorum]|nr:hypothetical protein [Icmadophila ericetorum]